MTYIAPVLER